MTNDASSSPSLSPSLSLQLIEPLLVLEEHKSARNHSKRRFTVVFFVGVVFSLWFSLLLLYFYNGHEKRTLTYRDRTQPMQPTLFSVVDSETLDYARASEHYTDWRHTLKKPFLTTKLPVVLKLSKTNIFSLRESLVVSWETIKEQVQDTDAIALFCDDHLLETATIAQARATSYRHNGGTSPNHWYIPHFPLSRVSTCHFILFRQSIPMAFSPPLNIHLMDFPTNLHLALGDDVTKMVIQFTTGMSGIPVAMYNGTISKGLSTTYQAFDMCGPPANKTGPGQFVSPGFLHTVEMVNLLPDTTYSYQVGLQDRADRSDIYEFTSPPNVGDDSKPYTYVVYGDQGCPSDGWAKGGNYTAAMVHRELSKGAKAVHHFGDLSYARGAAHIWDEWMTMIQPFSTKIPLMIAVGNHVSIRSN